jgi:hypothetical protein
MDVLSSIQKQFKSRPDRLLRQLPVATLTIIAAKTAWDTSQVNPTVT